MDPVMYDLDHYLAGEPSDDMTEEEIAIAEDNQADAEYDRWMDSRED